jgi:hypothetical protein
MDTTDEIRSPGWKGHGPTWAISGDEHVPCDILDVPRPDVADLTKAKQRRSCSRISVLED